MQARHLTPSTDTGRRRPTARLGHAFGAVRRGIAFVGAALVTLPQVALADLPSIQDPTNGTGSCSLSDTIQGYAAYAAVLLGLILTTAASAA